MSRSDNLDSGRSGSSETTDSVDIDLGSASDYVDGSSADWVGLITFLLTIPILIAADALSRLIAGLLALPRLGADATAGFFSRLIETGLVGWASIFETSFGASARSVGDVGLLGFIVAVGVVIAWYLVLAELLEVL